MVWTRIKQAFRPDPWGGIETQHVVPHDRGWAVKRGRARRASSVHDTKRRALEAAIGVARHHAAMLVIHGRDGRIQETRNYGT